MLCTFKHNPRPARSRHTLRLIHILPPLAPPLLHWTTPQPVADPIAQVCTTDPAKWAVPEKETFLAMVQPMVHEMVHETVYEAVLLMVNETAHEMA